jgi:Phage regulatory protein CII (CP76).
MDHIDSAIYDTVHNSGLAPKQLAELMGMSHQVLLNKANPQCEANKFSVHELMALQRHALSTRIVEAMCLELGFNALGPVKAKAESLMDAMLTVVAECGDVSRAVHDSLEDGKLTNRERNEMQREINEAIDALMSMRLAIKEHK